MSDLAASAGWGLAIGGSLVLGALAASTIKLPERVAATMTALGGGLLFAAVAFELVPEADEVAGAATTALGLMAGALVYVGADAWLTRESTMEVARRSAHAAASGRDMPGGHAEAARGESIAAGLFVDGVAESVALGLTVAEGEIGLALLVGVLVGNVVEAYGAAQPIIAGGHKKSFAIGLLAGIGLILAVATVLGGTVFIDASATIIGTTQAVAAGAVLAVVSVAIIPHAFDEVSRIVAVAAVAGFIAGYLLT